MKGFKAYFWNGFGSPELIATSITGLLKSVKISDNYTGDATSDMRCEIKQYTDGKQSYSDMLDALSCYNIYINPTFETFVELSKQWFDKTPAHLLTEFTK
ncbi:hypothetical protein [Leuconostoc falkenbergense]|uniref:hypothetical protein n=1 Tax=Leuconostoc falkenbergense TaxID=2766470 RepID=UPI001666DB58|nr:hypothetical protein [Leuconostoc falkenbergense]